MKVITIKNQNTRDRILDASLKIFSQKGFLGATTKEIAMRAQVGEATLFRLFISKDRLFEEVLHSYTFLNTLKELLPDLIHMDYQKALETVARKLLEDLTRRKALFRILHAEAFHYSARVKSRYFSFIRDISHTLASYLLDCQEKGLLRDLKPEIAADAFLGMFISFFIKECILSPQEVKARDREEIVLEFIDIFVRGTIK